jgi:hypothetical protein
MLGLLQAGERSQRAAVQLQPSAERVSVRLKELGETWDSPPAGEQGGAPANGKHKHHRHAKEHKEKKHRHGKDRGGDANGARSALAQNTPEDTIASTGKLLRGLC